MEFSKTEKGDLPIHTARTCTTKSRRTNFVLLSAFLIAALGFKVLLTNDEEISGQTLGASGSLSQEDAEQIFLSVPDNLLAEQTSAQFSKHPHLAGSPEDFEDAKAILELFQTEFDIHRPKEDPIYPAGTPKSRANTIKLTIPFTSSKPTAWIDTYYPLMDMPLDRSLEIIGEDGSPSWTADLSEDGDTLDEDAAKYRDYVPAWHGLSGDGQAEGNLVYVNYGAKADYDELLARGVDFSGKIVIARYGAIYRGLKIEGAELVGAAGAIIYSDPRDDGFVTVDNGYAPYPTGPARNPTSVQRGSSIYFSKYPGDPTTPGYPAYENASRTDGASIPNIPSLPISWRNAQRLLLEIDDGITALQLTGRSSSSKIKLVNHVDAKITPIWNTMAAIPGHIRDEVVMIGCHRDAWVLGAADPVSGTVSLVEIIRAYGELLRNGWKPLRTILFASWDAEEYGLIGSVEYGEDFAEWISEHVVAYLNVDVSSAGSAWQASGSPSLAHLIRKTALDVPHPTVPGKTLWDARNDEGPFRNSSGRYTADVDVLATYEVARNIRQSSSTGVAPLGSGSDYTVFLQHLGVASTDQGFGGTPYDAPYHYHSIYDSIRWQQLYADPGFHHHIAVAKHLGLLSLRVADATIIPLNTTQYAYELDSYLDKVDKILAESSLAGSLDTITLRASIIKLQIASVALDAEKDDAEKTFNDLLGKMPHLPTRRDLDATPIPVDHKCSHRGVLSTKVANWVKGLFGVPVAAPQGELELYWPTYAEVVLADEEEKMRPKIPKIPRLPPILDFIKAQRRVVKANKKLIQFERGFISEEGIHGRGWYKHLGVSPGRWLGYGATTLPGLTEAITIDKNLTLAQLEIERLVTLLDKLTDNTLPEA